MHLFLIRHGESVDNVAGLYAGSRDSALTSHGVLQARRLASHLAQRTALDYVYSSNLERAVKTAEALVVEQKNVQKLDMPLVQLASLREKDFGRNEGVKFGRADRVGDGAETVQAIRDRIDEFLDQHLVPLLAIESAESTLTCAVVAHGIILSTLYRSLCSRASRGGMSASIGAAFPSVFWDNTGYLECTLSAPSAIAAYPTSPLGFWSLCVKQVNCVSHLKDLKKTRGGIGSAAHDERQQTLASFFSVVPKKDEKNEDEEEAASAS